MMNTTIGAPSEENASNNGDVRQVTIKSPPFYRQNTKTWFAQLEAQFMLARITSNATKYYHALAALPEDAATLIDIGDDHNYESLKEQVLQAFEKSKNLKLEEALNSLDLGGLKPSLALIQLKRRFVDAGITPNEDILKHRLLATLPYHIQTTLAAHRHLSLNDFVGIADTVMEVSGNGNHVMQIYDKKSARNTSSSQHKDGNNSGFHLGLRPFHSKQLPQICRSHIFYGEKAKSCKPWCRWPGVKPKHMDPSSRSPSPANISKEN